MGVPNSSPQTFSNGEVHKLVNARYAYKRHVMMLLNETVQCCRFHQDKALMHRLHLARAIPYLTYPKLLCPGAGGWPGNVKPGGNIGIGIPFGNVGIEYGNPGIGSGIVLGLIAGGPRPP